MDVDKRVVIEGRLHPYFEQGYEGRFDCTVFDNAYADGGNGHEHTHWLENGDYLKIVTPENEPVWEGEICFVDRRFWEFGFPSSHRLKNIWLHRKQKNVRYRTWMEWFWSSPALRAELIRKPPRC